MCDCKCSAGYRAKGTEKGRLVSLRRASSAESAFSPSAIVLTSTLTIAFIESQIVVFKLLEVSGIPSENGEPIVCAFISDRRRGQHFSIAIQHSLMVCLWRRPFASHSVCANCVSIRNASRPFPPNQPPPSFTVCHVSSPRLLLSFLFYFLLSFLSFLFYLKSFLSFSRSFSSSSSSSSFPCFLAPHRLVLSYFSQAADCEILFDYDPLSLLSPFFFFLFSPFVFFLSFLFYLYWSGGGTPTRTRKIRTLARKSFIKGPVFSE